MATTFNQRSFVQALSQFVEKEVLLRGWVCRLRVLARTTFVILRDCSGKVQCVAPSELLKDLHLKLDDTVEISGRVRSDSRAKSGYEVDIHAARVLNRAAGNLPFNSSLSIESVGQETLLEYRPLAVRNKAVGNVFRIQAALLRYFREYLTSQRFTEIITSKIVASGTEGGTNLFTLQPTFRNFEGAYWGISDLRNSFKNKNLDYSCLHRMQTVFAIPNAFSR